MRRNHLSISDCDSRRAVFRNPFSELRVSARSDMVPPQRLDWPRHRMAQSRQQWDIMYNLELTFHSSGVKWAWLFRALQRNPTAKFGARPEPKAATLSSGVS